MEKNISHETTRMLAEIGRGNASVSDFKRLTKFKSNAPAKFTAPPSGLFLEKVLYKGDAPPSEKKSIFPVGRVS